MTVESIAEGQPETISAHAQVLMNHPDCFSTVRPAGFRVARPSVRHDYCQRVCDFCVFSSRCRSFFVEPYPAPLTRGYPPGDHLHASRVPTVPLPKVEGRSPGCWSEAEVGKVSDPLPSTTVDKRTTPETRTDDNLTPRIPRPLDPHPPCLVGDRTPWA